MRMIASRLIRCILPSSIIMSSKKRSYASLISTKATKRVTSCDSSHQIGDQIVLHEYENIVPGRLLKRYKRFLGDVSFDQDQDDDKVFTVIHVPNTGPMSGLLDHLPAPIYCSESSSATRKYPHTLEWIQPFPTSPWIGVHSAKANAFAYNLLESRSIPQLSSLGYKTITKEVKYGNEKSRIDFLLEGGDGGACYVEVKSVTLAEEKEGKEGSGMIALFPDTVSDRAQRHVRELISIVQKGGQAALLFVIQRGDCTAFSPCHEKDVEYGRLVVEAARVGVKMIAVACELDIEKKRVLFKGEVQLDLQYKYSK